MSHFTVTVCLDGKDSHLSRALAVAGDGFPLRKIIEAHLDHVLAPFDENREVEPYPDYEEGGPEDHWLYTSLRQATEPPRHETDPKARQALAHLMAMSPEKTRSELTEEQERRQADADLFRTLPDPVTWADVARVYNEKYGDEESLLYVDALSGRAYTMSTRNPRAKWDWWAIGGRWGGYFPYREGHDGGVVPAEPHWSRENEPVPAGYCDGGPLRALDLDRLRKEKMSKARKDWAAYQAVVAGTPEALPWSAFRDNVSEGNGYDIEQARTEYNSQPRIKALRDNRDWAFTDNEDFACGEKLYIERARAGAVPGWATLTTDGRWMEQGDMGWFGLSDATDGSKIGYWEAANAYIGSLPDDAWLVTVDMHI